MTARNKTVSTLTTKFIRPPIDAAIKKKNDRAVQRFIIEGGKRFETASGSGFINLCSVITQGQYYPSHPTTLSRQLGGMVDDLHNSFKQSI